MKDIKERFLSYVDTSGDCWNWQGGRKKKSRGYGQFAFSTQRKSVMAHRASWELFKGKIPEGLCVLHSCDNPSCVRPSHLFLGTTQDNNMDKTNKGRQPKGETHGRTKLSAAQVKSILKDRRPQKIIAQQYGVCQQAISHIKRRINWKVIV